MVTLINPIILNEFELHLRAILHLPVPDLHLIRPAASAVILAQGYGNEPRYEGLANALSLDHADIRIFGKPNTRPYRRMGVALVVGEPDTPVEEVVDQAKYAAASVKVLH